MNHRKTTKPGSPRKSTARANNSNGQISRGGGTRKPKGERSGESVYDSQGFRASPKAHRKGDNSPAAGAKKVSRKASPSKAHELSSKGHAADRPAASRSSDRKGGHNQSGFTKPGFGKPSFGKRSNGKVAGKPARRAAAKPEPVVVDPWAGWMTDIESAASFADLGLSDQVLKTLEAEGYAKPTPIQSVTIPAALDGRDILGCAQTGTGKTAAFALPIIEQLAGRVNHRGPRSPSVLVLAPTRELASQIAESFATYSKGTGIRGTTIYGGVSQRKQEAALHRGVDVIVATPGRLIDLLEQDVVDLSEIRYLAIDEADRMLDMGFIMPIRRIASELTTDRQTLLFSATMPPKVVSLADSLLKDPFRVAVPRTAEREPKIEQSLFKLGRNNDKMSLLETLLVQHDVRCGVVFTKTKHGAERVGKRLRAAGIRADAIHGNKTQAQRQRALDSLRSGYSHVLVATDVAARGLDVDGVTHVFNFDLPLEPEAYIHRIGRTGRAGATGLAIAFCSPEERGLLRAIESLMGKAIPVNHEIPEPIRPVDAEVNRMIDDEDDDDAFLERSLGSRGGTRGGSRAQRDASGYGEANDRNDSQGVAMADRVMRPTPHWQDRAGSSRRTPEHRDRSNASRPRTKPGKHR